MSLATALRPARSPRSTPKPHQQEERLLHISAAILRYVERLTVEEVAERLAVSPPTVKRWTAKALTYSGPAGDRLRAIVGRPN